MNQYKGFAYIYDCLMENANYPMWVNYIEEILQQEGIREGEILEIACGTGNITLLLAEKGYLIIGLDISEDMLSVAKEKALAQGKEILFIQQDMRHLNLPSQYQCILCMCDGINYITNQQDLVKVFSSVYKHLNEGGIFLFDISSYHKLKNILGNHTFAENLGDLCYIWENNYNPEESMIEMDLVFFVKEGQFYKKIEEYHIQKAYGTKEVIECLKKSGFHHIKVYSDFQFCQPAQDAERIFFLCKKM